MQINSVGIAILSETKRITDETASLFKINHHYFSSQHQEAKGGVAVILNNKLFGAAVIHEIKGYMITVRACLIHSGDLAQHYSLQRKNFLIHAVYVEPLNYVKKKLKDNFEIDPILIANNATAANKQIRKNYDDNMQQIIEILNIFVDECYPQFFIGDLNKDGKKYLQNKLITMGFKNEIPDNSYTYVQEKKKVIHKSTPDIFMSKQTGKILTVVDQSTRLQSNDPLNFHIGDHAAIIAEVTELQYYTPAKISKNKLIMLYQDSSFVQMLLLSSWPFQPAAEIIQTFYKKPQQFALDNLKKMLEKQKQIEDGLRIGSQTFAQLTPENCHEIISYCKENDTMIQKQKPKVAQHLIENKILITGEEFQKRYAEHICKKQVKKLLEYSKNLDSQKIENEEFNKRMKEEQREQSQYYDGSESVGILQQPRFQEIISAWQIDAMRNFTITNQVAEILNQIQQQRIDQEVKLDKINQIELEIFSKLQALKSIKNQLTQNFIHRRKAYFQKDVAENKKMSDMLYYMDKYQKNISHQIYVNRITRKSINLGRVETNFIKSKQCFREYWIDKVQAISKLYQKNTVKETYRLILDAIKNQKIDKAYGNDYIPTCIANINYAMTYCPCIQYQNEQEYQIKIAKLLDCRISSMGCIHTHLELLPTDLKEAAIPNARTLPINLGEELAKRLTLLLLTDGLSLSQYSTRLNLQSKNGSEIISNLNEIRPIGIMSQTKNISKMFVQYFNDNCPDLFSTRMSQFGAKRGVSTIHCYSVMVERIHQINSNQNNNASILSIDLEQAYDRVKINKLLSILNARILKIQNSIKYSKDQKEIIQFEMLEIFQRYVMRIYTTNVCTVGNYFCQKIDGIIQGDPLAPILFAIYINQLMEEIPFTKNLMDQYESFQLVYQQILKESGDDPNKFEQMIQTIDEQVERKDLMVMYFDDINFVFTDPSKIKEFFNDNDRISKFKEYNMYINYNKSKSIINSQCKAYKFDKKQKGEPQVLNGCEPINQWVYNIKGSPIKINNYYCMRYLGFRLGTDLPNAAKQQTRQTMLKLNSTCYILKKQYYKLDWLIHKTIFDSILNYFIEPLVITSQVTISEALNMVQSEMRKLHKIQRTVPASLMQEVTFQTDYVTRWIEKKKALSQFTCIENIAHANKRILDKLKAYEQKYEILKDGEELSIQEGLIISTVRKDNLVLNPWKEKFLETITQPMNKKCLMCSEYKIQNRIRYDYWLIEIQKYDLLNRQITVFTDGSCIKINKKNFIARGMFSYSRIFRGAVELTTLAHNKYLTANVAELEAILHVMYTALQNIDAIQSLGKNKIVVYTDSQVAISQFNAAKRLDIVNITEERLEQLFKGDLRDTSRLSDSKKLQTQPNPITRAYMIYIHKLYQKLELTKLTFEVQKVESHSFNYNLLTIGNHIADVVAQSTNTGKLEFPTVKKNHNIFSYENSCENCVQAYHQMKDEKLKAEIFKKARSNLNNPQFNVDEREKQQLRHCRKNQCNSDCCKSELETCILSNKNLKEAELKKHFQSEIQNIEKEHIDHFYKGKIAKQFIAAITQMKIGDQQEAFEKQIQAIPFLESQPQILSIWQNQNERYIDTNVHQWLVDMFSRQSTDENQFVEMKSCKEETMHRLSIRKSVVVQLQSFTKQVYKELQNLSQEINSPVVAIQTNQINVVLAILELLNRKRRTNTIDEQTEVYNYANTMKQLTRMQRGAIYNQKSKFASYIQIIHGYPTPSKVMICTECEKRNLKIKCSINHLQKCIELQRFNNPQDPITNQKYFTISIIYTIINLMKIKQINHNFYHMVAIEFLMQQADYLYNIPELKQWRYVDLHIYQQFRSQIVNNEEELKPHLQRIFASSVGPAKTSYLMSYYNLCQEESYLKIGAKKSLAKLNNAEKKNAQHHDTPAIRLAIDLIEMILSDYQIRYRNEHAQRTTDSELRTPNWWKYMKSVPKRPARGYRYPEMINDIGLKASLQLSILLHANYERREVVLIEKKVPRGSKAHQKEIKNQPKFKLKDLQTFEETVYSEPNYEIISLQSVEELQ